MQAYNGDCWLSSVLLALDRRRPSVLSEAVEELSPDTWNARIFNLRTRKPEYFTVHRKDLDDPRAPRIENNAIHNAVIHNAVVQYNNNTGHLSSSGGYRGLNVGFPCKAFTMLLGVGAYFDPMDKIITDDALRHRLALRTPLVLVTGPEPEFNLVKWHAYAVVGDGHDEVLFLNPWRTGGLNGDGLHSLNLTEARKAFIGIYFPWP